MTEVSHATLSMVSTTRSNREESPSPSEWIGDSFVVVRLPPLGAAETVDLGDWLEAAMQQVEPVPAFVQQVYDPVKLAYDDLMEIFEARLDVDKAFAELTRMQKRLQGSWMGLQKFLKGIMTLQDVLEGEAPGRAIELHRILFGQPFLRKAQSTFFGESTRRFDTIQKELKDELLELGAHHALKALEDTYAQAESVRVRTLELREETKDLNLKHRMQAMMAALRTFVLVVAAWGTTDEDARPKAKKLLDPIRMASETAKKSNDAKARRRKKKAAAKKAAEGEKVKAVEKAKEGVKSEEASD